MVNRRQEEPGSLKEAVALVFAGIFTQRLAPRALMLQNYSFMSHEMSAWFSVNMCLGHSEQTCALDCLNTLRQRQSPQLHFDLMAWMLHTFVIVMAIHMLFRREGGVGSHPYTFRHVPRPTRLMKSVLRAWVANEGPKECCGIFFGCFKVAREPFESQRPSWFIFIVWMGQILNLPHPRRCLCWELVRTCFWV